MKDIKLKIAAITLSLCAFTLVTSCDEGGEPDPGGTSMQRYAGDWWITISDPDGPLAPPLLHSTYNTAANDNTLWIDDHQNAYWIKCKVTVNSDGTFSGSDLPNLNDPGSTVTITEGKIIKNGGTSRGGHVVDSIYFRAHFSYDDEGYDIIHAGHKRTGFLEDEF
jgi:hypothetical protein